MKYFIYLGLMLLILSCNVSPDPQAIVDKAIENAGGPQFEGKTISFMFRGRKYVSNRKEGRFRLERITYDSVTIKDVLKNDGFERLVNDSVVQIPDSMAFKYSNSVNSVHYFAYLPLGLNDGAVHKSYEGEELIDGRTYYTIKVWFDQEGGGKDHDDVFLYWIDKENFTVDYMAYEYQTDGGGKRFRRAYNPRVVGGIRFVDYDNLKPEDESVPLEQLDSLYNLKQLELLSKIELKDIEVVPCEGC